MVQKPAKDELRHAHAIAQQLRDLGRDRHHLGHALLYLAMRTEQLERVLEAAQNFVRSGQDPQAHTRLVRAIDKARDASPVAVDRQERYRAPVALGL